MKLAIACEGDSPDANISPRGGRAPYYQIYEDGKLIESLKNPFAVGGGSAGWSIARLMKKKDVEKIIAGKIGPKMEDALKQEKIDYSEESPEQTVADFLSKEK